MDWERALARLSALTLVDIDPQKAEALLRDLNRIAEMFGEIARLEIPEEVEPLYTTFFGEVNLRDDEESEPMGIGTLDPRGERLESGYIKSPKTL